MKGIQAWHFHVDSGVEGDTGTVNLEATGSSFSAECEVGKLYSASDLMLMSWQFELNFTAYHSFAKNLYKVPAFTTLWGGTQVCSNICRLRPASDTRHNSRTLLEPSQKLDQKWWGKGPRAMYPKPTGFDLGRYCRSLVIATRLGACSNRPQRCITVLNNLGLIVAPG